MRVCDTKKTEVLSQLVSSHSVTTTFTVAGDPLPDTSRFTYLGSTLTNDCDLSEEIQQRIKLALYAFFGKIAVARHQPKLHDHEHRASVSHGVPVYFPAYACTKLYCLVTEARVCKQLAQGLSRQRSDWDRTRDLQSQVQRPNHYVILTYQKQDIRQNQRTNKAILSMSPFFLIFDVSEV